MISEGGIIIRIPVCEISEFARPAKGVRVMRVKDGEKVLSVARAEHLEEEATSLEETEEASEETATTEE